LQRLQVYARLGWVRDALAHMPMVNEVVNIAPHQFKQPSRSCYRMQTVENYKFSEVIYGITSIPNFRKILTDINYPVIKCIQGNITHEGLVQL
jgi:hypothetical protein